MLTRGCLWFNICIAYAIYYRQTSKAMHTCKFCAASAKLKAVKAKYTMHIAQSLRESTLLAVLAF